jgi:hypothetical protein
MPKSMQLPSDGKTVLLAASNGHLNVVELLIKVDAKVK